MTYLLEVCVDSAQGLAAAVAGGADRIELCSALDLGGLTPSLGLMREAAHAPVPVYAMIRPRSGDFTFDKTEEQIMLHDIDAVHQAGLAGVVLGAQRRNGALDTAMLTRLTKQAGPLGTTLHRVFDLVPNKEKALEDAIALGFERILTSGGATKAIGGLETMQALIRQADKRISIMPGSGVNSDNLRMILEKTGATEIHASCRKPVKITDKTLSDFGFATNACYETDAELVQHMRA